MRAEHFTLMTLKSTALEYASSCVYILKLLVSFSKAGLKSYFFISLYLRFCSQLMISQIRERGNLNRVWPLFIDLAIALLKTLHWLSITFRKKVLSLILFFKVTHIHSLSTSPDSAGVTKPTNSLTSDSPSVLSGHLYQDYLRCLFKMKVSGPHPDPLNYALWT